MADCSHRDAESETTERLNHHKTVLSLRLQNFQKLFHFENAVYSQESSSPTFWKAVLILNLTRPGAEIANI